MSYFFANDLRFFTVFKLVEKVVEKRVQPALLVVDLKVPQITVLFLIFEFPFYFNDLSIR